MEGHEIRDIREDLGLSQSDFAEQVGVSVATVSQWENDKYRPGKANQKRLEELQAGGVAELNHIDDHPEEDVAKSPPHDCSSDEGDRAPQPQDTALEHETKGEDTDPDSPPGIPPNAQCAYCHAEATDRLPDDTLVCYPHYQAPPAEAEVNGPESAQKMCARCGEAAAPAARYFGISVCEACFDFLFQQAQADRDASAKRKLLVRCETLNGVMEMIEMEAYDAFIAKQDEAAQRLRDLFLEVRSDMEGYAKRLEGLDQETQEG